MDHQRLRGNARHQPELAILGFFGERAPTEGQTRTQTVDGGIINSEDGEAKQNALAYTPTFGSRDGCS